MDLDLGWGAAFEWAQSGRGFLWFAGCGGVTAVPVAVSVRAVWTSALVCVLLDVRACVRVTMAEASERFREIESACGRERNSQREIESETCHVMAPRVLAGSDGVSVVVAAEAVCVVLRGVLCACLCGSRGCTRTVAR